MNRVSIDKFFAEAHALDCEVPQLIAQPLD